MNHIRYHVFHNAGMEMGSGEWIGGLRLCVGTGYYHRLIKKHIFCSSLIKIGFLVGAESCFRQWGRNEYAHEINL